MYSFELNDILFLVKSLKSPIPAFNIYDYVTFNTSATRSGRLELPHIKKCCQVYQTYVFGLYMASSLVNIILQLTKGLIIVIFLGTRLPLCLSLG